MGFEGPIVRPQTEADSVFIEVTVGCTHNSCTFCNFYASYPFRIKKMEQVEADLKEAALLYPRAKKVWASGGNPYALSTERLAALARLFKKYLPEAKISTYARVDDLLRKSVEEMRFLKELGFEDLVVGIESGDDGVLAHVNKGYTAADILEGCGKLEEAGVAYRVIYLGGLAGAGKAEESAIRTADVLNRLHPYCMFLTTAAILPGTELYREMAAGEFEEMGELERIREFRTLIANLENEIMVYCASSTTSVSFIVNLPEDREKILEKLGAVMERMSGEDEAYLHARRSAMRTV